MTSWQSPRSQKAPAAAALCIRSPRGPLAQGRLRMCRQSRGAYLSPQSTLTAIHVGTLPAPVRHHRANGIVSCCNRSDEPNGYRSVGHHSAVRTSDSRRIGNLRSCVVAPCYQEWSKLIQQVDDNLSRLIRCRAGGMEDHAALTSWCTRPLVPWHTSQPGSDLNVGNASP